MIPHKHAEVLRAIADGVPLSEFEVRGVAWAAWHNMEAYGSFRDWMVHPDSWATRRKPQYIMVNGFKVPKPLDVLPSDGIVYGAAPAASMFYTTADAKYEIKSRMLLGRGILHSTPPAAIAHAKAMLGIDPKWEEA